MNLKNPEEMENSSEKSGLLNLDSPIRFDPDEISVSKLGHLAPVNESKKADITVERVW
jgi:hypothetical protein